MYLKLKIISKNQLSLFPCRNITEDKGKEHNAQKKKYNCVHLSKFYPKINN